MNPLQWIWQLLIRVFAGAPSSAPSAEEATQRSARYLAHFDKNEEIVRDNSKVKERSENAAQMVDDYYSLATDLYLYGWGDSFHFAPRFKGETFPESLRRHEYFLISQIGAKPGNRVLDVGCGVQGPARNIARFSQAHVTGVTICGYQIKRAQEFNKAAGLSHLVEAVQGDFHTLDTIKDGSLDHAYAIEATCHSPDRVRVFQAVYNKLKPGGRFGVYEWVTTPHYDASNAEHRRLISQIESGDALPELTSADDVRKSFEAAGFRVRQCTDLAETSVYAKHGNSVPWYSILGGEYGWNLGAWRLSPLGRAVTSHFVAALEFLHIAPKGTCEAVQTMTLGANACAEAGRLKIFTPMLFVLGEKPLEAGGR